MKRWQLILFNVGVAAGIAASSKYLPKKTHEAIIAVAIPAIAAATNTASKTNPDGSPAEVPYEKTNNKR